MATIPLNKFVRTSSVLTLSSPALSPVYTVPTQRASIILTAQATNTSPNSYTASLFLLDSLSANKTFIAKDVGIGPNDAINLVLGKLVTIDGEKLFAYTNNNAGEVYFTLSILETINTNEG